MAKEARYDSKRVRLLVGEYERSCNRYEYRYSMYGKQFSVYADSLEILREKEREINADRESYNQRYKADNATINDIYTLWKELKRGIRERTYYNYCYCYDMYVSPTIGKKPVISVKKSDVKRFFNYLVDEKKLKLGTVDNVHTILHQVLQIALDDELIKSNPSDNAIGELMRAHNLQVEKRKALTVEEQRLLMNFLSQNSYYAHWLPIITALLETSLRIGEVTGLRWRDINFENRTIDVNHTLVYFDRGYTKGEHACGFAINATKTPAIPHLR